MFSLRKDEKNTSKQKGSLKFLDPPLCMHVAMQSFCTVPKLISFMPWIKLCMYIMFAITPMFLFVLHTLLKFAQYIALKAQPDHSVIHYSSMIFKVVVLVYYYDGSHW